MNPTELLDLDALEAKAKAATPGPWDVEDASITNREGEDDRWDIAEVYDAANRSYIAAFDPPPTVLRLIAAARAGAERMDLTISGRFEPSREVYVQARDAIIALSQECEASMVEVTNLMGENEALEARAEAAEAERDELRARIAEAEKALVTAASDREQTLRVLRRVEYLICQDATPEALASVRAEIKRLSDVS